MPLDLKNKQVIKFPAQVSRNPKDKEKLIEANDVQVILYRDFLEIHINFLWEKPVIESDDIDPVLANIEGYEPDAIIEQRNNFDMTVIERAAISGVSLAYDNHEQLYYISIGVNNAPWLHMPDVDTGRLVMRQLTEWWLGKEQSFLSSMFEKFVKYFTFIINKLRRK
jgi:hypothetical protein